MLDHVSHFIERAEWLLNRLNYRIKKSDQLVDNFSKQNQHNKNNLAEKHINHLKRWDIEQRYAHAFFLYLIIELNHILSTELKELDFDVKKTCIVYIRDKKKKITKIKELVNFFRNSASHPEDEYDHRKDPRLIDQLKEMELEINNSFSQFGFIEDENEHYAKSGGGVLYFSDIKKLLKIMKARVKPQDS